MRGLYRLNRAAQRQAAADDWNRLVYVALQFGAPKEVIMNHKPAQPSARAIDTAIVGLRNEPGLATLADHAEAWLRERGQTVPRRNDPSWPGLYHEWVRFAFEGLRRAEAHLSEIEAQGANRREQL